MKPTLVTCPPIGPHHIQRDDENRVVVIDHQRIIRFSPTQYRLLQPLLKSGSVPVADEVLVRAAFSSELDEAMRENLDKHFDHIRNKLRPHGLSVRRVVNYGYVLLDASKDR